MEQTDKKFILAMALCSVVVMIWYTIYPRQTMVSQKTTSSLPSRVDSPAIPVEDQNVDEDVLHFRTALGQIEVLEKRGLLSNAHLDKYSLEEEPVSVWQRLVRSLKGQYTEDFAPSKVSLKALSESISHLGLSFDDRKLAYVVNAKGHFLDDKTWEYEDEKIRLEKSFLVHADQAFLTLSIRATFKKVNPQYLFVSFSGQPSVFSSQNADYEFVTFNKHGLQRFALKDKVKAQPFISPVDYVGIANRHFLFALVNASPVQPSGLMQPFASTGARLSLVYPITGKNIEIPIKVYFGPKDMKILSHISPMLEKTIDLGWFSLLAYALLKALNWVYAFVHNYGIAIILITLFLKLITYPLTLKSMRSMQKASQLQPKLQKVKEMYKDNQQMLNLETMKLIRAEGYSPLAGCLPLLIQFPIFITLYKVLYTSIDLYQAPFFGWIQDLSKPDPYFVLPCLTTIGMFIQQKMTPTQTMDAMQQVMLRYILPLLFGVVTISAPSGLAIYMCVNTLASIVQQIFINRAHSGISSPTNTTLLSF